MVFKPAGTHHLSLDSSNFAPRKLSLPLHFRWTLSRKSFLFSCSTSPADVNDLAVDTDDDAGVVFAESDDARVNAAEPVGVCLCPGRGVPTAPIPIGPRAAEAVWVAANVLLLVLLCALRAAPE